jgi:hypothetical protein
MTFFDKQGNQIQYEQWLEIYRQYYFLEGPTLDSRIPRGNQTSDFVENQVCALLTQTIPLSKDDLILAMAWKIGGLIDHDSSQAGQKIVYLQGWPTRLTSKGRRRTLDFSVSIPSLAAKMPTILTQIGQGNPRYLFDLVPHPKGFGKVYILTVLFFATHGEYPIYDKYAHIAAQAINRGLPPGSHINYKELQTWKDYKDYMTLLAPLRQAVPQQVGSSFMFISRPIDRALWVYGHFFKTKPSTASTTRSSGIRSSAPVISGSNGVLVGRIRNLCQIRRDGWRSREIIIQQGANGYPKVSDCIYLVDSSGAKYCELPFIKGANVQGYVCLGKSGALKPWFTRRYPVGEVKAENVYFEPTGCPNEYQIYSESEWKARRT